METTAQRKQAIRDAKTAKVRYVKSIFMTCANRKQNQQIAYLKSKGLTK